MSDNLLNILLISLTVVPLIASYFVRKRYERLTKELELPKKNYYYHNIFTKNQPECRDHIIKNETCGENCSLNNLLTLTHYIASAKESISLCVLTLQLLHICKALAEAHQRGVKVRLILDKEMTSLTNARIKRLRDQGIPIRCQKVPNAFLHHKFCLIDEFNESSAKLVVGSMNFTLQGIVKNFEHVTLTNNFEMIKALSDEFELLWEEFT